MKHIVKVAEEKKINEIEKIKSKILYPFSAPKGIWPFDFINEFLQANNMLALPCLGSDQFAAYEDNDLERLIILFKHEKLYMATLNNIKGNTRPDEYYELDCNLASLKEIGENFESFRLKDDMILFSKSHEWFILFGWDVDIVVGTPLFLVKYFKKSPEKTLRELQAHYPKILDNEHGFVKKALNLLNEAKKIENLKDFNLKPVRDVDIPLSIRNFKNEVLEKNSAKLLSSFNFNFQKMLEKRIIPLPIPRTCNFFVSSDSELSRLVELWKEEKEIYICTTLSLSHPEQKDEFYKIPLSLESIKWIAHNPKKFRTSGHLLLTTTKTDFVLIIGGYTDVAIGTKEQIEFYIGARIQDIVNDSENFPGIGFGSDQNSVYFKCYNYLKSIGYEE